MGYFTAWTSQLKGWIALGMLRMYRNLENLCKEKKSIPSDGKFEGGKKGHLTGKWEGLSEKGGDYFLGAINFIKIKLDGM